MSPSPSAADSVVQDDPNDLVISRLLRAPRSALWRAWTEPELLKQWWCPKPWTTEVRAFDLRPGGAFHTFMQGPDGGTIHFDIDPTRKQILLEGLDDIAGTLKSDPSISSFEGKMASERPWL